MGSDYGGYSVVLKTLTADSVVYSFGLGEDISFDQALMEEKGLSIFGFDPSPRSMTYIQNLLKRDRLSPQFVFEPMGLSPKKERLIFLSLLTLTM